MSLLAALPLIDKVLDFIPNKNERERIKGELEAAEQRGELDLALGQISVNKQEAAHSSIFVSGWRPFCGWVCGTALGYSFILAPFLDIWFTVPKLETGDLMTVLLGMLGMGGLRSFEKSKQVARN